MRAIANLRTLAIEESRFAVDLMNRVQIGNGRWVRSSAVVLIHGDIYAIRRRSQYKDGPPPTNPVIAKWTANGWQEIIGQMKESTAAAFLEVWQ